ncbi:hypothetical protein PVL29_008852 [Vitis rotundifolia]|uniref:pectinesterase n=1 Tax=Vitis rotundifolia TaxID=103349 RepID=A0AA39DTF5_VITRO|nr:hypothetical protein PVL29_008852 [Vitis rotundifolia]
MIGKAVVSGISLFLVVGVIIGIVSVTRPHGSDRTDGDTNMATSMKAVASVCATADYKNACVQTLSQVAKNGSYATPKDYIQAAVQVTIKEIKSSMNLSEKLVQATNDSRTKMALGDCEDLLQFAIDKLQESFSCVAESNLLTLDQRSTEIMNWLSAVVSYQQTCLDGVIEPRFQTAMQKGLLNATQLTSNALAIVSDLSQIPTKFNVPLDLKPNSRRLLGEIEVLGHDGYPTWFSATDRKLLALQDNGRLKPNAIVAKDGSGNFTTIAAALAAYPKNLKGRYVIYVKAGIYREYITVTKNQVNVYMYGDGPRKTIVTGTKSFSQGITTYNTATFSADGKGFVARSMGFVNTAGPGGKQAVALRVQSDMSAFFNCRMDGYQDTLYILAHRQFYRNCVISGTVDFIFGDSTTVIQNSLLIVRRPNVDQQNTVTAHGKTEKRETTGLVIHNCRIIPEQKLFPDRFKIRTFLGRPWKPYSKTIIMETTLGDFIQPAGWKPWDGGLGLETLFYAEYQNLGPGANTQSRVKWKGYKIIKTRNEALQYTASKVEARHVDLEERGYTFKRERHADWIIMRRQRQAEGFNMRSRGGGFLKQIGTLYASYATYQIQNGFLHSTMAKTPFSFIRPYSTELQPQLSTDLIGIMEQRLSAIEHRSAYLQDFINRPEASPVEYARANKELRKLRSSIEHITELRNKQKEIDGLKSLMAECSEDKDMLNMAAEEMGQATEEEKRLQNLLLKSLLPKDEADERDCILEVRAGTGGEEASLFAMDIFKMYEKYSQKNGWKFEVVDITESDLKGYKEASGAISGSGVYGKLKFESGIHRVQRVPVTEKSGRVHTSAVSVAILPQADEVDVQLRNEDLRIDTYRSGGSGGQHANTTNSAVRITHIPSGMTVAIQDERSQHMNKAKALKVLCAKLYEIERSRIQKDRSKLRMEQIGSGDRSERIRTYNFPQGRVTDHRVGITHHSVNDVMQGENLDVFIDALLLQQEMDAIASFSST